MSLKRWIVCCLSMAMLSTWVSLANAQSGARDPVKAKSPAMNKDNGSARTASPDITARLQAQAAAEAAAKLRAATGERPSQVAAPVAATELPVQQGVPDLVLTSSLSPELLIAQQIHQGHLPCELGASVRIEADARQPGYFHVHGKGFRYRMFPVQTSTGTLRLEDKKAGAVWLQLANKSMLMDHKRGRRLADECAHPDQLAFAEAMKTNPPPSLLDPQGLGR